MSLNLLLPRWLCERRHLTAQSKLVWAVMWNEFGVSGCISTADLAALTGLGESAVRHAVQVLTAARLLTSELTPKGPKRYELAVSSEPSPSACDFGPPRLRLVRSEPVPE